MIGLVAAVFMSGVVAHTHMYRYRYMYICHTIYLKSGHMSMQHIVPQCSAIVHVLAQFAWNTGQQVQTVVEWVMGQILQEGERPVRKKRQGERGGEQGS